MDLQEEYNSEMTEFVTLSLQEEFDCELVEAVRLFRKDGTAFKCLACDGFGEITIKSWQHIAGTSNGPAGSWFDGYIQCINCGAHEYYSDSDV